MPEQQIKLTLGQRKRALALSAEIASDPERYAYELIYWRDLFQLRTEYLNRKNHDQQYRNEPKD